MSKYAHNSVLECDCYKSEALIQPTPVVCVCVSVCVFIVSKLWLWENGGTTKKLFRIQLFDFEKG